MAVYLLTASGIYLKCLSVIIELLQFIMRALGRICGRLSEIESKYLSAHNLWETVQQDKAMRCGNDETENQNTLVNEFLSSLSSDNQDRNDEKNVKMKSDVDTQNALMQFYACFEECFRGSRNEIKKCLEVYIPYLRDAKIGTEDMPVIDLGCGRGEWIEVLLEQGMIVRGVDQNLIFIEQCRERGFDVEKADALALMQGLPDASMGAVTGFHLIEHLPFEILTRLLAETKRVLKPGGYAIFETPDPQNLLVGSCNFYLDPTHGKPLPAILMKFLLESVGLRKVEILKLHPYPASNQIIGGCNCVKRLNELLYGPQDYAVIGRKI